MRRSRSRAARIAALEWTRFRGRRRRLHRLRLVPDAQASRCPASATSRAEWLFVGEAPGAEEDARGEPFVGQAGRLLDNMLAALGMRARPQRLHRQRAQVPAARTTARPSRCEVDACRPYLDRQIALIRPKLIVALGKSAATTLLDIDATIASLRGRVHRYRGVPLVVTYHPAYLLRNLPDKAKAWEDLLLARRDACAASVARGAACNPRAGRLN